MKSRETKQKDLNALTAKLKDSKSAMVVSFTKATVNKDQQFRSQLRDAGANYQVVKNTLARIAVKGTVFEEVSEYFKGVTALAWTDSDPVVLSKAISKFIKENPDVYTFKTGVVDGRLVDLKQVQSIASLPSKEELISKLLFVINAQAQRIVTVINAVPRNLAVVIKQIGDAKPAEVQVADAMPSEPAAVQAAEEPAPAEAEVKADAPATEEASIETTTATEEVAAEAPAEEAPEAAVEVAGEEVAPAAEEAPGAEAEAEEKAE